ncbi:unknown (plasmid) [Crocosphaera subtropica ATCC 51142]|uniref:Uncharacterized protein n=1 Tax=Crocosphaera subtropica (strain ATCC 51142 / BH68) TaxID=43989 RepID=B1X3C7_CROS5|nr:hypothetical protein [Crocosphaera subtropica]ACB54638.1 unknown [Crocosphaera subtropica ATCC 51142]
MLKTANLSKVIEAALNYAKGKVNHVIEYQESEGYICSENDVFIRAIFQADDVEECHRAFPRSGNPTGVARQHFYFYTYLQKEFYQEDNEEETLDLSEVLIQEAYLDPDGSFNLFEHGYGHPLEQEELDKAVWKSSEEETPIWARIMELS